MHMSGYGDRGRLTKRQWEQGLAQACQLAEQQQRRADAHIGECERIQEETKELTNTCKELTDHRLLERVEDIVFSSNELQKLRKEICEELKRLETYRTRLTRCLMGIRDKALQQCCQCIILRERRLGIDLVVDEVEVALHNEKNIILGAQDIMEKALAKVEEQMRRLRAALYFMDHDLKNKESSVKIDRDGIVSRPGQPALTWRPEANVNWHDLQPWRPLQVENVTNVQWEKYTEKNIKAGREEISCCGPLRAACDSLFQQVYSDLVAAQRECYSSFLRRQAEIRHAKQKLEDTLIQTKEKVLLVTDSVRSVSACLEGLKPRCELVNTRKRLRSRRPGFELVMDAVEKSLEHEEAQLQEAQMKLQYTLNEAKSTLRYLLQTQMQLTEEIAVKTESLRIDEVECMPLRETIDHHLFYITD